MIVEGLCASQVGIEALLDIGPHEREVGIALGRHIQVPQTRCFADYIAMRNDRSQTELVPRIELVIDELAVILQAFIGDLMNANALASDPQIYRTLMAISKRDDVSEDEIEILDPRVRSLLAMHYPGGRALFAPGTVRSSAVRAAARAALKCTSGSGQVSWCESDHTRPVPR